MAKTIQVDYNVETVLGKKLDTPLSGQVDAIQYESIDEAKTAGEWPNEGQILKMVNTRIANNARQAKVAEVSKSEREKIEATPEYKLAELVKNIRASNPSLNEAKAQAMAESILKAS